jgi:hypothetical protein
MHYSRVCGNGPSEDVVCISQVDNNDLVLLVDLFADTYEVVGFKRECLRSE